MKLLFVTTSSLLAVALLAGSAAAQKGTGESTGMARRAVKPPIEALSGTVKEVKVGACKLTTGRSTEGVHLIVEARDGRTINLHLGPSSAIGGRLAGFGPGQAVTFDAFRTDRMPKDAFVAKSLKTDQATLVLRDDNLRPSWAAGRGGGRGGALGLGRGQGRRANRAWCWW